MCIKACTANKVLTCELSKWQTWLLWIFLIILITKKKSYTYIAVPVSCQTHKGNFFASVFVSCPFPPFSKRCSLPNTKNRFTVHEQCQTVKTNCDIWICKVQCTTLSHLSALPGIPQAVCLNLVPCTASTPLHPLCRAFLVGSRKVRCWVRWRPTCLSSANPPPVVQASVLVSVGWKRAHSKNTHSR